MQQASLRKHPQMKIYFRKSKNKKDKQENDKPQTENKHDDNDDDM